MNFAMPAYVYLRIYVPFYMLPIEYVCWALKYVQMNKLLDIEFICWRALLRLHNQFGLLRMLVHMDSFKHPMLIM